VQNDVDSSLQWGRLELCMVRCSYVSVLCQVNSQHRHRKSYWSFLLCYDRSYIDWLATCMTQEAELVHVVFPTVRVLMPFHLTPSVRGIPSKNRVHIWYEKTRTTGLQSGRMVIDSVIWAQYMKVADRQTATWPWLMRCQCAVLGGKKLHRKSAAAVIGWNCRHCVMVFS